MTFKLVERDIRQGEPIAELTEIGLDYLPECTSKDFAIDTDRKAAFFLSRHMQHFSELSVGYVLILKERKVNVDVEAYSNSEFWDADCRIKPPVWIDSERDDIYALVYEALICIGYPYRYNPTSKLPLRINNYIFTKSGEMIPPPLFVHPTIKSLQKLFHKILYWK